MEEDFKFYCYTGIEKNNNDQSVISFPTVQDFKKWFCSCYVKSKYKQKNDEFKKKKHISLLKNNKKMNEIFMKKFFINNKGVNYGKIDFLF